MVVTLMMVMMNALNDNVFHFPGTWRVMESTLYGAEAWLKPP